MSESSSRLETDAVTHIGAESAEFLDFVGNAYGHVVRDACRDILAKTPDAPLDDALHAAVETVYAKELEEVDAIATMRFTE